MRWGKWLRQQREGRSLLWKCGCSLNTLAQTRCLRLSGGNRLVAVGAVLWRVRLRVVGHDNTIILGHGSLLRNAHIRVLGDGNRLEIGEYARVAGGFLIRGRDNKISVGARTYIGNAFIAAAESTTIRIGEDCLLADEADLGSSDSHSIIDLASGERLNPASDIVLGDRVWVAKRATLLKGSVVGSGSIVGACSLVTGEIPDNAVAAGVPAKVIRAGVTWRPEKI